MRYVANKAVNIVSFGILGLICLLVIFLLLFLGSDFYLAKNHTKIEDFISKIADHPVTIAKIKAGNHGLDPALVLHNIIVYDQTKTTKILQAQKFKVSIDLMGSLLSWRLKPGLLTISAVNLSFDQDQDRDGSVDRLYWQNFKEFCWLFEQSQIVLTDINISLRLANGLRLKFNDLNLNLSNDSLWHQLSISGRADWLSEQQKAATAPAALTCAPAKFMIELRLNTLPINSSINGLIKIEDLLLNLPKQTTDSDLLLPHDLIPAHGQIDLVVANSQLVSDIFPRKLPIDNLSGHLVWQKDHQEQQQLPGFTLSLSDFSFTSGSLGLTGGIKILSPMVKFDPIIDADIDILLENLAQAKWYYPVKLMPPAAVAWLNDAFVSSGPMFGKVVFKGQAAKFPFDHQEGVFLADANINNVHLNYDKAWPALTNITGKLIFSNRSMEILAHHAKILQSRVDMVRAFIPNLDRPLLSVDSLIKTESQLGLAFIKQSPLKASLGEKLQHISLRGPMQLGLKLLIPLDDADQGQVTQVSGKIGLVDNYLHPKGFDFGISKLAGELSFTQDALFAKNLRGELFNYPATININTATLKTKEIITKIILTGKAAAKDVAAGFAFKLDEKIKGATNYQALFEIHNTLNKNSFLRVDTDLQGVLMNLPEPLAKTAASVKKSSFTYYFSNLVNSKIIIKYGNQVTAAFDHKQNVAISADKLDLLAWSDYLSGLKNTVSSKSKATFNELVLKVGKLKICGQNLSKALLLVKQDEQNWSVNITALPQIQGNILISKAANTQISGTFEQLELQALGNTKKTIVNLKPQNIPPLDLVIKNFSYNNRNFHRLALTTKPQPDGMAISKLSITHPDFKLLASGSWVTVGAKQQQTSLHGSLSTSDAGSLLANLELNHNVIGGIGGTNFELNWPQAPYDFSLKNLAGTFTAALKKGYIVNLGHSTEVKLGVGKALNALNLRHLSLDITSITKKGLKFDNFNTDAEINHGSARIKSLKLDGPIAGVRASGLIGLVAKDYDMYMSVIPHITSSVPIAATFAGGPIIGLLSWVVADVVVAPVIKKATTYKYHITGGWDDPKVEKS